MAEQRDSITGRNSVEVIVNPSDVEDLHDMEVGKRMELGKASYTSVTAKVVEVRNYDACGPRKEDVEIGIERHGVRVLVRKVSRRAMSRSMVLSSRFAALVDVEGVVHCDEGNVAGSNTKQSGASSLVSKSKGSSLNSVSKGLVPPKVFTKTTAYLASNPKK
ncbi:hypothetical protein V6N12_043071 [Hibiscus sabdariffa]|uniref:Uncharacterized protein n=1 Tax=Hibiscus sabdariffa TaxID=183260 RepID=A0ABR2DI65_9ROSI